MRRSLAAILLLLLLPCAMWAQGGQATQIRHGITLPATCTQYTDYFSQDGVGLFWCDTANHWAYVPSGGSMGPVTEIDTAAPITGGPVTTTGTIGITQSTTSTDGYLSHIDWNAFNSKLSAAVTSITANSPLTGGTITSTGSIGCQTASGSQAGCLSLTDWNTFNNKQNALTFPLVVSNGGTGVGTLTAHGVLIGQGTGNVGAVSAMAADTLLQGQGASSDPAAVSILNCGDSTHALAYSTSTHTFSCQAISSGSGTVTTTGSPSSGNLTKFSGATSITNGDLSGDVTTSGTLATTVGKVNGVSYGSGPSTNTVPVVTGTNAVTYETVPNAALANSAITINGTSTSLGGSRSLVLNSSDFANEGTTTQLLHGNASGNPAFGSVVSADMNITPTSCTNQLVSAISSGGVGTCSTVVAADTDTSIAHTGVDVNTSYQVTSTHLSAALPVNQGGTGATTSSAYTFFGNNTNSSAAPGFATITSVNAQSGAGYTVLNTDFSKLITVSNASAQTLTLPSTAPASGWWIDVQNTGAGAWTVSRNGLNIDGGTTNPVLTTGQGVVVWSNGSNYFTSRGLGAIADATLTSGQLLKGDGKSNITVGDLAGDVTTSGSMTTTVGKVDGVAYPSGPSTHTVPVITASNTATYKSVPDCTDTTGNHLNYMQSTDAFSCGTSASVGGSNTDVQFNNSGALGGDANFIWDNSTKRIGLGGVSAPRTLLDVLQSGTVNTSTDTPGTVNIVGPTSQTVTPQLTLGSNDAMAASTGGSLTFQARYITSNTNVANFAYIFGAKENATSSNLQGLLSFVTRNTSGNFLEGIHINSSQVVSFPQYTAGALVTSSGGSISAVTLTTGNGGTGNANGIASVIQFGTTSAPACSNAGTTTFIGAGGGVSSTTEASVVRFVAPVATTLKTLQVKIGGNVPASQSAAFKISKNGSTTGAPACTVAAGASTCSDTSTTLALAAGDLVDISLACSGGTTSLTSSISADIMAN